MSLTYGSQHGPKFHMFVKNSFMQRVIAEATAEGAGNKRKIMDWEAWGPENTRLFEHNVHFQWLRWVLNSP